MPGTPQGQLVALDLDTIGRTSKQAYDLLINQTANTSTTASTATSPWVTGIAGGDYIWRVEGAFGNGTVTLQVLRLGGVATNDTDWLNVRNAANTADVTATANTSIGVGIGQNATVRAKVAGATAPALYSTLAGL